MTKNAASLPDCDCLGYCGDDPRIDKGQAAPCLSYRQNLARRRLEDAAPALLLFARAVAWYASNAGDDYLANKAREIINEVTGESTP